MRGIKKAGNTGTPQIFSCATKQFHYSYAFCIVDSTSTWRRSLLTRCDTLNCVSSQATIPSQPFYGQDNRCPIIILILRAHKYLLQKLIDNRGFDLHSLSILLPQTRPVQPFHRHGQLEEREREKWMISCLYCGLTPNNGSINISFLIVKWKTKIIKKSKLLAYQHPLYMKTFAVHTEAPQGITTPSYSVG